MTAELTPNGLSIDTFTEALDEIQTLHKEKFGAGIKLTVSSSAGQLQRILALRDQQWQETLLALYQGVDPRLAEGVLLDRAHSLLGVTRLPDTPAEVLGTYTGTPTTVIPLGSRVSIDGNIFTTDAEYTVGGGGTIDNVLVIAELPGEIDVSILEDTPAEVLGTYTGTPFTAIPDGTRVSVAGNVFATSGTYEVGGGGTVAGVLVIAEINGELDVSGLGAWTVVDTLGGELAAFDDDSQPVLGGSWTLEDVISGITAFDDDSQPVVGRLVETDSEFRARAEIERFRRAIGPLSAIDAALIGVDGVTYGKAFENVTVEPVDADGIGFHGIKVVVEGGTDLDIVTAMRNSFPAGHLSFGSESVFLGIGPDEREWFFDRVTELNLWVKVEFLTSTSEESTPADLEATAKAALMDFAMGPIDVATGNRSTTLGAWQIGTDVLAHRLEGALADIPGADEITVTTSLDDVTYIATKRDISIAQRAVLTEARITVTEV